MSRESSRRLRAIEVNHGEIIATVTGITKVKINFRNPLNNLDFMFSGCEDLISVDLSHTNSPSMTSMIYTFTNCKNLQKVDFTSLQTSQVTSMDFFFAGCTNLMDLKGLENIDTSSVKKTAGMFIDCHNLLSANLSAFQLNNIEEQSGMFINNPSLQTVDLGNNTDLSQIFSSSESFNVIIYTTENGVNTSGLNGAFRISEEPIRERNCTVINWTKISDNYFSGEYVSNETLEELEKCYFCDENVGRRSHCGGCYHGYYLPLGIEFSQKKCRKCDEGCSECVADKETDLSYCTNCSDEYEYKLYNGKCIKRCNTSDYGDSCKTCNPDYSKYNECLECNEGYYFDPNHDRTKCKEIEIANCINATIENDIVVCKNCTYGNIVFEHQCYKSCQIGEEYNCATCNTSSEEFLEFCGTCNDGYFLYPNNSNNSKCYSCVEEGASNCNQCEWSNNELICLNCSDGYTLAEGKCIISCDDNCMNCTYDQDKNGVCSKCNEHYYLKETGTTKQCIECPIGCSDCEDDICFSCLPGFTLNGDKCVIIQCDIGNNNKCLTCLENAYNV